MLNIQHIRSTNTVVFVSGLLLTVRRGHEIFSCFLMLKRWLKVTCTAQSVNCFANFNIFWECRHFLKADKFGLNKSGVRLSTFNIFYSVNHTSVSPSRDDRDKPKQLVRQPSGGELLLPEKSFEHTRQLCQEESSQPLSLPLKEECPPASTRGNFHSPPTQTPLNYLPSPKPLTLLPHPGFHRQDEKACQCWNQKPFLHSVSALSPEQWFANSLQMVIHTE